MMDPVLKVGRSIRVDTDGFPNKLAYGNYPESATKSFRIGFWERGAGACSFRFGRGRRCGDVR